MQLCLQLMPIIQQLELGPGFTCPAYVDFLKNHTGIVLTGALLESISVLLFVY